MQYDIYIPQTANVFDEDEVTQGVWLRECGDIMGEREVEKLFEARMNAVHGEEKGYVDLVLRMYRE